MTALTRAQVLAYRWVALLQDGVLGTGVQDNPPGRTATLALQARGVETAAEDVVLVHGARGAAHMHRVEDRGLFAAALQIEDPQDLMPAQFGALVAELHGQELSFTWALDHVAEAMRAVTADVTPRTKGELSGALIDLVDARLRPWCEGCGAFHVHDALFRWATLQAGLVIDSPRYLPGPPFERRDPEAARREVVRRFLHLTGPARPAHLAAWLALSPAGARNWWPDDLASVTVDGRRSEVLAEDLDALRSAPAPADVRLLPPYDPLTELADRELLVPDRAQRTRVWRASTNPGVLVADGEIAGVWRRPRRAVEVEPFHRIDEDRVRAAIAVMDGG